METPISNRLAQRRTPCRAGEAGVYCAVKVRRRQTGGRRDCRGKDRLLGEIANLRHVRADDTGDEPGGRRSRLGEPARGTRTTQAAKHLPDWVLALFAKYVPNATNFAAKRPSKCQISEPATNKRYM